MTKFAYPAARRDETVVEDYHGTKTRHIADSVVRLSTTRRAGRSAVRVADPYRWLEDPDSKETQAFVEAQNEVTIPFLNKCEFKQKLQDRITEVWDYPKYGCPFKRGDNYYYYHNTGLQNQSVMYVQDSIDGEPRVFLDPNKLSEDGTIALRGQAFSEDGKYLAYGLSSSGSDWVTMKFKSAPSGEDLPDVLERVKFSSMAWTHDHKGIFYNCYPEQEGKSDGTETTSNLDQKLFYHRLGQKQSEDVLVAEFPENPKWMIGAEVTDCGRYLILSIRQGCDPVNRLYYVDLNSLEQGIVGKLPYIKVVDNFDAEYEYITNEGTVMTFKTNLNSPRYRLINIDFSNHGDANWTTLVEEDEKNVLEWVGCVNGSTLVLCYLKDVKNELYLYDLKTGLQKSKLPLDVGTVVGYSGRKKDTGIFYQFMSFLTPGIIFHCDMTSENTSPKIFRQIAVKGFDFSQFETKQVFFPSKDGTKVPMFIVHKKGIELDGNRPVLLYGYGGFNVSITPSFSVSRLVYMQHLGGVLAVPNIRGGGQYIIGGGNRSTRGKPLTIGELHTSGTLPHMTYATLVEHTRSPMNFVEYGETWHKAGCMGNKQNGFDDFQAAAEYLIQNKYTQAKRIVINGGSNGGLLVAACANQRPDLFGAVVNQVGVLDMLRFHKFTIGHAWTTDYGCADNAKDFEWLYKYSPLHNIQASSCEVQYPPMLLLTGDHDDRVVPLHSLKFIAEMQHRFRDSEKQTNPLLIRIDTKSGHGSGKPTAKIIEEVTEIYCFVSVTLGLQWTN